MEFDPYAKFGFEIQIGDEIPKFVTLDELKELIKESAYKREEDQSFLNFQKDQKTGLSYVDIDSAIPPTRLSSHILVNTCMEDPDSYDWRRLTDNYDYYRIADYAFIWTHPYTWIPKDDNRLYGCLVSGKVATMKFDRGRVDKFLFDWFTKMRQERVLFLADKMPVAIDETDGGHRGSILRGMLVWDLITTDGRNFLRQFLKEDSEFDEELDFFHIETFRDSVLFIAQERGGKVAADLVQRLRKDWKAIVNWKCFGIDKISSEQIEEFRACLFEGMDYYLEQWDAETPKSADDQQPTQDPDSSFFAVTDRMTYEICKKELLRIINSAKNKSAACREILRSTTAGYFVLSDKTDQEKADAVNPWVSLTSKKYVFTGDDFRKARNS